MSRSRRHVGVPRRLRNRTRASIDLLTRAESAREFDADVASAQKCTLKIALSRNEILATSSLDRENPRNSTVDFRERKLAKSRKLLSSLGALRIQGFSRLYSTKMSNVFGLVLNSVG
jgi:hypothetical protein